MSTDNTFTFLNAIDKLAILTKRYRRHFILSGSPTKPANLIRLACFVRREKPTDYQIFRVTEDKAIVFYNA